MKKVLITGILGQDGSNMAEHLLSLDQDLEIWLKDYQNNISI